MPPEAGFSAGQLVDVYTSAIHFERHAAYDPDVHGADQAYSVNINAEPFVHEDRNFGSVDFTASIEWMTETAEGVPLEAPFDLEIRLTGLFDWSSPELDEQWIESWLEFNAANLLWPYLRAQVAAITAGSDLPALTLFTLSVPRPRFGGMLDDEHPDESVTAVEARSQRS